MDRPQHMPERVQHALEDLARRLRRRFGQRIAELRLFGSYARGDQGPDSDVDVLVAVDGLDSRERREVFDTAEDVFFETLVRLAPMALSADEWRTLKDREYRIAADVEREGRAL